MYNTFAATPAGHEVCTTAEVVDVDGKRVDFKVSTSDGIEEIGSATTTNLCSFNERLAKKRSY
jgi:predicted thioesterase